MFEYSNIGSRKREIRDAVSKNGIVKVEVVGSEDLQDYINSFADSCDVELLVNRAVNGEPNVLNQNIGTYGDFTNFPKTYAEVLDRIINATNLFNSLSVEVRSRFDNDVYKFVASMDEPDWFDKAGFVTKETKSSVTEDNTDES